MEPQPYRTFDEAGLEESVRASVSRILNSRSHIGEHLREYVRGTVLDYGLGDISQFSPASETDRLVLGDRIAASIAQYEPRLRDVRVKLAPHPTNPRAMAGELRASLGAGTSSRAVSFPLAIDGNGGSVGVEGDTVEAP